MLRSQLSRSEGNRRGNTGGNSPSARGVPPRGHLVSHESRSIQCAALGNCFRQLQSALRVAERGASGGDLCRPTSATPPARRSIAVPWRERPPFWTAWSAKPAASEVVAHATLSLPQPEGWSSDSFVLGGVERVQIHVVNCGRRNGDCAARNSRAQGAARFLDFAPPALRAADGLDRASRDPFPATIDGRAVL